jgi:hypothetical protein
MHRTSRIGRGKVSEVRPREGHVFGRDRQRRGWRKGIPNEERVPEKCNMAELLSLFGVRNDGTLTLPQNCARTCTALAAIRNPKQNIVVMRDSKDSDHVVRIPI